MFEKLTREATRALVLAQDEARRLNHNYMGTEHVLLGLLVVDGCVAAQALTELSVELEAARSKTEEIIGQGMQSPSGHIPFTPRVKRVLEFAERESLELEHASIGTGHLLLGLIREGEGVAACVLTWLGLWDLNQVRVQVIQQLNESEAKRAEQAKKEKLRREKRQLKQKLRRRRQRVVNERRRVDETNREIVELESQLRGTDEALSVCI